MERLSRFSVEHPVTILMGIAAILLLGFISFQRLAVDLFPDISNPRLFVELKAGELPPEELETRFVENLEALIMRQRNVTGVSSVLLVGSARVSVSYAWGTDMNAAFLDLQKNLSRFSSGNDIDELSITQFDPNAEPVLLIALNHPEADPYQLQRLAETRIRNALIRLDGIAAVEIRGGEQREVRVQTDEARLEAYGLTAEGLASSIRSANLDVAGGSVVEMGVRYVVRGLGSFDDLRAIKKVVVDYRPESDAPNAREFPVFLEQVADVNWSSAEPENIVYMNGQRGVALAVYKETRFNTIQAVEAVNESLLEIRRGLPDYSIEIIRDQARFINAAISEVEESALYGIILAIFVLFLFLRRIGSTLVISLAIPLSIVATFNLMFFNGLTLNIMTLGGLALGAGMLVDNAIVVMESIFRELEQGATVRDAAIKGTARVSGAIIASTITTVVVFLPIVYLQGAAGVLFRDQAWTVAFSLLASLVVAILAMPMLSHKLLRKKDGNAGKSSIRFDFYRPLLERILHKRAIVLLAAVVLVVATLAVLPFVGSNFLARTSGSAYTLDVTLADGTTLDYSARFAGGLEESIRQAAGEKVEMIFSQVGSLDAGSGAQEQDVLGRENHLRMTIRLSSSRTEAENFEQWLRTYLEGYDEAEVSLQQEQNILSTTLSGSEDAAIAIRLYSDDAAAADEALRAMRPQLEKIEGLVVRESSLEGSRPQVNLVIDRVAAAYYNIPIQTISSQLEALLQGAEAGNWEFAGDVHDIRVAYPPLSLERLRGQFIRSGAQRVPLEALVKFETERAPRALYRTNQKRSAWLTADTEERPLSEVVTDVSAVMENSDIPPNVRSEISGEEQERRASFAGLQFALLLAIVLIYMVLAGQFESLLHPFTIILTVPLAAIGAVWIFLVLGQAFNVMAFIGLILLMGIAVNDSIILVDAINQERRDGRDIVTAILNAGERRIRPIIMTSLTTILALLPLTFGFGEGAALRAPLAWAVIGGLVSSTVLILGVIPCLYSVFEQWRVGVMKVQSKEVTG